MISVCVLVFISGCFDEKNSLTENTISIPVFINSELTLTAYMIDTSAIDNLADELSMPWSITTSVIQYVEQVVTEKTREVNNCNSALAAYDDGFETVIDSQHTSHTHTIKRCKAM